MSEYIDRITIGETTKMIKDTTYESKQASQGGTDVSLVTTGEKYTWNEKLTSPSTAGTNGQVLTSDGQGGQSWQTPSSGTITDVQVNGTSVVSSGVANVSAATNSSYGVIKPNSNYFGFLASPNPTDSGSMVINTASDNDVKTGTNSSKPITPGRQDKTVFFGLSKVAGVDLANETVTVGTYPANSQAAIRSLIGAGTYSIPSGGIPSTDLASDVIPDVSGKVDGASSSTNNHVAVFDGATGKAIKDSGYTIGKSVPSDAVFTDTKVSDKFSRPSYIANPIDDITIQPLINDKRANHLAFLPADQIIIEKTTDGGTTWTDANISDENKVKLFSELRPSIQLPLLNGERSTLCGLRVTFTAIKYNVPENTPETGKYNYWNSTYYSSTERYNNLREFYFWISSNSDTIKIKIERAKGSSSTTWETAFNDETALFTGWSGNDYISISSGSFGGGSTQASNYWNYRITFMSAYKSGQSAFTGTTAQNISEIRGYGTSFWTAGNNYAAHDHLYSFDKDKNAIFPAAVTATNFVGTVNGYSIAKSVPSDAVFTDTTYVFDGTYNSSSNKAATVSTVTNAINGLDGGTIGTGGVGKTITALSQTNGNVSATFSDISITKSQVSDFPSTMTPSSHTHGNIQNGGTLQTNDVAIANGDKLVVTDSSDSSKIARTSITFDGSTASKALTQKGTWESFTNNAGTITEITMNGASKGTSGVIDLGTVITSHQDISGKADKADTVLTSTLSNGRKSNTTSGTKSIAFGLDATASSGYSVALGNSTTASNQYAIAEGYGTTASGSQSHACGSNTIANHANQFVFGKLNVADPSTNQGNALGDYIEIVGNGTSTSALSNARALDWSGNQYLKGDLYVGCDANSENGSKVAKLTDIPDVSGKMDTPTVAGTSGQILTSNGNGGYSWENLPSSDSASIFMPSSPIAIPASGASSTYVMSGITADYILTTWNFSTSAENEPPVSLEWTTSNGTFTITNVGGTTSETIQPMFTLPIAKTVTLQT